jgi:hypothetical protein
MKKTTRKSSIICVKQVRKIIQAGGMQAEPEFIDAFERFMNKKLQQAIQTPNGKCKRLDASIAGFVFGNY